MRHRITRSDIRIFRKAIVVSLTRHTVSCICNITSIAIRHYIRYIIPGGYENDYDALTWNTVLIVVVIYIFAVRRDDLKCCI